MELPNENQAGKSASKRSFDVAFLTGNRENEKNPGSNKKEKSAFTKYKDRRNNAEEVSEVEETFSHFMASTEGASALEDASSRISSSLTQSTMNMMHFPALRKLLDITGGKNFFKLFKGVLKILI